MHSMKTSQRGPHTFHHHADASGPGPMDGLPHAGKLAARRTSWAAQARLVASDWTVRLLCIASVLVVALLVAPLPFRPWDSPVHAAPGTASDMALAWTREDPVARLIQRLAHRVSSGQQDVNVAAAAGLSGLRAHPGTLHFLRVGTWRMAAADAVEANPWISDEALAAALARAGAPEAEVAHVMDHYPVLMASGDLAAQKGWTLPAAPARPRIVRTIEDAMARSGMRSRISPDAFDRLVAEGLRCSWLTTRSAGTLMAAAGSPEQAASLEGMGSLEEDDEELRRQAADVQRWCADFFADRLIELHGIDPAMAVQLALNLAISDPSPPATIEQAFPPRYRPRPQGRRNAPGFPRKHG